jgi:hypothetical protein
MAGRFAALPIIPEMTPGRGNGEDALAVLFYPR